LLQRLDDIELERQWVITQARKGRISDEDMEYQLGALSLEKLTGKKDLASIDHLMGLEVLDNWEQKAREYLEDIRVGLESLNAAPQSDEERREQFEIKRQIVKALVERVDSSKDRELTVNFRLNVLEIAGIRTSADQVPAAETYTRIPASPAHRHLAGSCG
ncbi:MAG TPA: hypothetical protein VLH85_03090, partial [Levilinea sp.]|nr:hypothetical protein [Levilinea sp.]